MLRLRQICLVARDLRPVVEDLRQVLGLEECFQDPAVAKYGLENSLLPIGSDFLEVVAPTRPETAAGRYLERRHGDGGYMVILQSDDEERRRARMETIGVRIINSHSHEGFTGSQLHPKDTGGALLEIGRQAGDVVDGPWHPAGPSWSHAVRGRPLTSLAGATVQTEDPAALALRWSEVLERPIERGPDGWHRLTLDNADLWFVHPQDSRGEGLIGIDVRASDPGAVLAAARDRGWEHGYGWIRIAGIRVDLI